ncbi:MAG: AMP-binding protein, partial [Desulfomonilaceae bacterium]
MTMYDERPWVKNYDPGVEPEIELPEASPLEKFREIVESYPNNPAAFFYGEKFVYRELERLANKFANALLSAGCQSGDVVAINLPNIPQYLIAQLGVMMAGCVASGLSPLLLGPEMTYQLNDGRMKALVTLDAIFELRLAPVVAG